MLEATDIGLGFTDIIGIKLFGGNEVDKCVDDRMSVCVVDVRNGFNG